MKSGTENSMAWLGLAERVCVVTGGAGGIGSETAMQMARAGASVAVLDRTAESCREVVESILLEGGRALAVACDVSSPTSVALAAEAVEGEFGPCNVLVNNAGLSGGIGKSLLDASIDDWNRLLAVNLTGVFLCSQTFGKQMRDANRGGTMVHVASIGGTNAIPGGGAYSVSKAGVVMLSKQLCLEYAQYGIRSNCVSPGLVRTPMSEAFYQDAEKLRRRNEIVPSGRAAGALDIAESILFLSSPRSGYINGEDILVEGGLSQIVMANIPRS
ncbi:SDR family oxidoreductase [Cupriavidus taiwanensis]|uniref:SDR family NAD(P)-dependent oxidoreductase n=1 Tax=Cupriavidus taiwanensis TaxID=164546 RepID=UPI000E2E4B24|nr:SDR family oxidoreductase [Cupriavidus taiwanensis]